MKRFISYVLKYNQDKISWVALVIIVSSVVFSNLTYANKFPNGLDSLRDSNLGGPLDASLESLGIIPGNGGVLGNPSNESDSTKTITDASNVIVGLNAPEGYSVAGSVPVREYTVQEDDTISSVAGKFGISTETLAISNNISDLKSDLTVGSTLTILPIDGVQVRLKDEETLDDLASRYKVAVSDITEYNNLDESSVSSGQFVIVPDAVVPNEEKPFYVAPKPTTKVASTTTSRTTSTTSTKTITLPVTSGYFAYPTTGYNYGVIHSTNGVDISNSCGTPIYASAEGTVTTSQDGWNGGYGSYIKITHPNGVVTLYGHLSQRTSQVGNQVAKGQLIGLMGTTGRSTGCHLHFEVRGAANPLAR